MSEPIRILNLFTIMNRGGAETMVMNYYRAIDRSKIQFDFMVHRQERGAYDDEIEAMGGRIFRMCPIYPQNLFRYQQMLKEFFDNHPEYQILHSHMSELGYFAFKEAIRHDVPVRICHAHGTPNFKSETTKEKFKYVIRETLAYLIRKSSTDYFACSKEAGEWLFGKKKKIIIMNNAIDITKFTYHREIAKQVRQEFNWENKYIIGHVGRFSSVKNHTFLIDIFNTIQKDMPNSILVLLGDGELKPQIEKKVSELKIENKVFFLGARNDVYRFYQTFDIFIFPSLYEGFGNVLLEAQACGIQSFTSKDVVPQYANITPLLHYIPLSYSAEHWKSIILTYKDYQRKDMSKYIQDNGFDIHQNAEWLTNFYLNKLS
ncbi:glycosyltransferase family 1 protein [Phocaeicola coprocola]|uniref:glycosyltransferase family 1 protein n=1 Tax=Phocaeicola coprocola TaxID=310298 RepID=UPI002430EA37|nr:glycosyltransferase family 1 protein [Phocaeicola coprocola]